VSLNIPSEGEISCLLGPKWRRAKRTLYVQRFADSLWNLQTAKAAALRWAVLITVTE